MQEDYRKQIKHLANLFTVFGVLLFFFAGALLYLKNSPETLHSLTTEELVPVNDSTFIELDKETILASGFIDDLGVSQVIQNCTQCHSAKLVTQNKLSEEGWKATIRWMQASQNLWDLGSNEERIIAYLAKNYGPESKGRRENLTDITWYELE